MSDRFWQIVNPAIGLTLLLLAPLVIAPTPSNSGLLAGVFADRSFQLDPTGYFPPRESTAGGGQPPIQFADRSFQFDPTGYFAPGDRPQEAAQSPVLGLPANGKNIPLGRGESFTQFTAPTVQQKHEQVAIAPVQADKPSEDPPLLQYTLTKRGFARMVDLGCQRGYIPMEQAFATLPDEKSGTIQVEVSGSHPQTFEIKDGGVRCVG